MDDYLKVIIPAVVLSVVLLGFALLLGVGFEKFVFCPNFAEVTQLETKYNFWAGGCFVRTEEGKWVNTRNYIGITK